MINHIKESSYVSMLINGNKITIDKRGKHGLKNIQLRHVDSNIRPICKFFDTDASLLSYVNKLNEE